MNSVLGHFFSLFGCMLGAVSERYRASFSKIEWPQIEKMEMLRNNAPPRAGRAIGTRLIMTTPDTTQCSVYLYALCMFARADAPKAGPVTMRASSPFEVQSK